MQESKISKNEQFPDILLANSVHHYLIYGHVDVFLRGPIHFVMSDKDLQTCFRMTWLILIFHNLGGFSQEHLNEVNDPLVEQAIIDSIEEVYYNDDSFDTSEHELKVKVNTFLSYT